MNLWKALQMGLYILQKLQEFGAGGSTQFSFDVSYKGQKYTVLVNVSKLEAGIRAKSF